MNYYETLGINPDATANEIKRGYRILAKKYHPDTYQGDKTMAENKMKELNEAYDTLSNSLLKREYDERIGVNQTTNTSYSNSSNSSYYDSSAYAQASYKSAQTAKNYYGHRHAPETDRNRTTGKVDFDSGYYKPNYDNIYYDRSGYARANCRPDTEEETEFAQWVARNGYDVGTMLKKKLAYLAAIIIVGPIVLVFLINSFIVSIMAAGQSIGELGGLGKSSAEIDNNQSTAQGDNDAGYTYNNIQNNQNSSSAVSNVNPKDAPVKVEITEKDLVDFINSLGGAKNISEKKINEFINDYKAN